MFPVNKCCHEGSDLISVSKINKQAVQYMSPLLYNLQNKSFDFICQDIPTIYCQSHQRLATAHTF